MAILFAVLHGASNHSRQNRWNKQQPVVSTSAQVIAKRTEVSGSGGGTAALTFYYATFETSDKERHEFSVSGKDYGLLIEGDQGILTFQGTRYKGFERGRAAQQRAAAHR